MTMNEALRFARSATSVISRRAGNRALSWLSWIVFAGLDVTDQLLCPVFAFLDFFLDSEKRVCYCWSDGTQQGGDKTVAIKKQSISQDGAAFPGDHCPLESWTRRSDSLYARVRRSGRTRFHLLSLLPSLSVENDNKIHSVIPFKRITAEQHPNVADEKILLPVVEQCRDISNRRVGILSNANSHLRSFSEKVLKSVIDGQRTVKQAARWSDCGCERCTSWQTNADQLLYVHVEDKDFVASAGNGLNAANVAAAENNVIFVHGFLSSSSFWADTVLPALPKSLRVSHRLFAVDIMGFGKSPKPVDSLYTIAEHIEMIRRSVLVPHGMQSFHLVAHSMGCTIALALAAQYPSALKSITLIAPPYFPAVSGDSSSTSIMQQAAARRIWPLITFGSAVMSWYEHVGRVVCFVICKHHRFWEPLLLFLHSTLPGKRVPLSCVTDFTRHTHHSAWHIFHNTLCSGGYAVDHCLEVLREAGKTARVIHGTKDAVIPFKNSVCLSERHSNVRLTAVPSTDHATVVFGREEELAEELAEEIFLASV